MSDTNAYEVPAGSHNYPRAHEDEVYKVLVANYTIYWVKGVDLADAEANAINEKRIIGHEPAGREVVT